MALGAGAGGMHKRPPIPPCPMVNRAPTCPVTARKGITRHLSHTPHCPVTARQGIAILSRPATPGGELRPISPDTVC